MHQSPFRILRGCLESVTYVHTQSNSVATEIVWWYLDRFVHGTVSGKKNSKNLLNKIQNLHPDKWSCKIGLLLTHYKLLTIGWINIENSDYSVSSLYTFPLLKLAYRWL